MESLRNVLMVGCPVPHRMVLVNEHNWYSFSIAQFSNIDHIVSSSLIALLFLNYYFATFMNIAL